MLNFRGFICFAQFLKNLTVDGYNIKNGAFMAFSLLPSIERARYCWLWLLIGHLPWEVWTCTPIDHCRLSCFFFLYFKLSQLVPTAKLIILIFDKIQIQLLHVLISVFSLHHIKCAHKMVLVQS